MDEPTPRLREMPGPATPSVSMAVLHANLDITTCDECSQRNLSKVFECDELLMVVGKKRLIGTINEVTKEVQNIQIEQHTLPNLCSMSFDMKMPDCSFSMESPIACRRC